jgi:hypothetical protein
MVSHRIAGHVGHGRRRFVSTTYTTIGVFSATALSGLAMVARGVPSVAYTDGQLDTSWE